MIANRELPASVVAALAGVVRPVLVLALVVVVLVVALLLGGSGGAVLVAVVVALVALQVVVGETPDGVDD